MGIQGMVKPGLPTAFRPAERIQRSAFAALEKRTLIWLAERTPAFDLELRAANLAENHHRCRP